MKNLSLNSIREKREKQFEKEKQFERDLKEFLFEVKKEMLISKILYNKAKFSCFSDNIFTFEYSNHSTYWEFNIICDDSIFRNMTIKNLLELKNIKYFENSVYCKKTKERLGGLYFKQSIDVVGANVFEDLIKDFSEEEQEEFRTNGFYMSDGLYLHQDGSYSGE